MKRIICISIFILFLNPMFSFGQETRGIDKNLENISGQYAECAAYYTIVYHAMNSSDEKSAANAYSKLQKKAMFYSLLLAAQGRSKELAAQVTNSRIEMYMKKMKQEANNDYANISILINKYHFGCQELMENPSKYVVDILAAEAEKAKGKSNKK